MPNPQRVDDRFLRLHPELFQKTLLMATVKSFLFYQTMKAALCPMEEARKGRRPDFQKPEFNQIYDIVADYWDTWAGSLNQGQDYSLSLDTLEELLHSEIEGGRISQPDALAIFEALKQDYEALNFDAGMLEKLPKNPLVTRWIDKRAAANIVDYMHNRRMLMSPSLADLKAMVDKAQSSMTQDSSRVIRAADLMFTKASAGLPFETDLPLLNNALGGGFRPGTTTLVAGINGGGKTILACQWAKHFAWLGAKVVVFTTEQPPDQLLQRIVCNHLKVGFDRFMNPAGTATVPMSERRRMCREVSVIPDDVYREYETHVTEFYYTIWPNLFFVDWSQAKLSVYLDFDREMDRISATGWDPDVVIFDWIGGGIDSPRDLGPVRMDIRLLYKEAIEAIISHGKRTNRVMVAMTQLNKTLIRPTKKSVLMSDLAECKSMTDNVTNFIGISAMQSLDSTAKTDGVTSTLLSRQYLNVDKARMGPKGLVPVDIAFRVQAFNSARVNIART